MTVPSLRPLDPARWSALLLAAGLLTQRLLALSLQPAAILLVLDDLRPLLRRLRKTGPLPCWEEGLPAKPTTLP